MYAIIETGGKQFRVQEGDAIYVEKLNVEAGSTVTFDRVLVVSGEGTLKVGTPVVAGATVEATVEKQGKSKKVVVFKYKPKKCYSKKMGHRQAYTKVVINKING